MGEIITCEFTGYKSYAEFKNEMNAVVDRVAEGFVEIGYLLKVARDTNILEESGYKDVNEFAKAEYGLDKSAVSRFIDINNRFSEGGYAPVLVDRYKGYGRAKLSLMLLLPDSVNEELSPEYSKEDIQQVREAVKEEEQITDLEVMMEGAEPAQVEMDNNLKRFMHQLWHDIPLLYRKMWRKSMGADAEAEIQEILAPSGEGIYTARIRGTGKLMLSVRGKDDPLTLTNIRTGEKEQYTWTDIRETCALLMWMETPEESWSYIYGEQFPEVAPVQQKGKVVRAEKAAEQTKAKKQAAAGAETEKEMPEEKASAAAVVPEDLKPEYPPRPKAKGDGISYKEPKPERKPVELPPQDACHTLVMGQTMYADILVRGQRFLIIKDRPEYREGNTMTLKVMDDAKETGMEQEVKITHLVRDHGGVTPGYCVIQVEILPPKEKQLSGQMCMEDVWGENEQENTDETDKEAGVYSEGEESDT